MIRLPDIMTEDEFVAHAMRGMKLFKPRQPSNEEFLAVRMQDDAPDDQFLELVRMGDMRQQINETAAEMFALFICDPEGHA